MYYHLLGSNTYYNNTYECYQTEGSYTTANYYDSGGVCQLIIVVISAVTSAVILCNATM